MRLLRQILIILSGILLPTCVFAYPEDMLFRPHSVQSVYSDSIYHELYDLDTGKSIEIMNGLIKWATDKGDSRFVYELRMTKDRYTIGSLQNKDAAINDMIQLLEELKNKNLPMMQAKVAYVLGDYYWGKQQYASAFEYAIIAYNHSREYDKTDDALNKSIYASALGGKYYYFKDFNTAKKYFTEAIHVPGNENNSGNISITNTVALCYLFLDNYDSAKYYFTQARELAIRFHDNIWPQIIDGNLGYTYYLLKEYDKAIPLLDTDIARCRKDAAPNAANSLALLSDIYLIKNDKAKAMASALDAYSILFKDNSWKNNELRRRIYPAIAKAYAANGDMAKAYAFYDSGMRSKDTVAKQTNALILAGLQHHIEANERLVLQQQHDNELKMNKWIRNVLSGGIVLLLVIALLIINRQNLKNAHEQQKLKNKSMHAETELANAQQKLADFTRSISEKNDLIETFSWELNRLKKEVNPNKEEVDLFLKLQQHAILTDEQWDNFRSLFETVHKGFIEKMNTKVPGLSPVDMRFMLLCKLRLSAKEMAAMLGISVDAVKLNKQRLRAKLSLPDEEYSIEDFVYTL